MWQPEQPPNQTVARRIFINLIGRDPLLLLARGDEEFQLAAIAFHFAGRRAFVEQRAGRAGFARTCRIACRNPIRPTAD